MAQQLTGFRCHHYVRFIDHRFAHMMHEYKIGVDIFDQTVDWKSILGCNLGNRLEAERTGGQRIRLGGDLAR